MFDLNVLVHFVNNMTMVNKCFRI